MAHMLAAGLLPTCLSRFSRAARAARGAADGDVCCAHAFLSPPTNSAVMDACRASEAQTRRARREIAGLLGPLLERVDPSAPPSSRTV